MTIVWHIVAALVLIGGLAAQIYRPVAPVVSTSVRADQFFSAEYIARAEAYRAPLDAAVVASLLLRVVVVCAVAFTPGGRRLAGKVIDRIGPRHPLLAATAVIVGVVVLIDVVQLPLAFWAGVIHDGAYGLRTQSAGEWLRDWLVQNVPLWLAVAAMTAAGYGLARRLPTVWPAVAGCTAAVLGFGVVLVAPVILEPLEHRVRPLEPGSVRDRVTQVAADAGLNRPAILEADASRRSIRQNAYVSGLGPTRRIVLYDTLIQNRTADQIAVIVAHEIGHTVNGDAWRGAALGGAGTVIATYVLAVATRRAVRRGTLTAPHDPRGAPLVLAVISILLIASLPIQHLVSRRAEAAADAVALHLSDAPSAVIQMQTALTETNLARPVPPGWVHLLWGSHPTPVERIARATEWSAEAS